MKWVRVLSIVLFGMLLLLGCEDKKDEYSGFSDLVGERNEARQSLSEKNARGKKIERQRSKIASKEETPIVRPSKKEEISTHVLYERDIAVVDSSSQLALAKGIAYLNKEGQIVKIKIIKE